MSKRVSRNAKWTLYWGGIWFGIAAGVGITWFAPVAKNMGGFLILGLTWIWRGGLALAGLHPQYEEKSRDYQRVEGTLELIFGLWCAAGIFLKEIASTGFVLFLVIGFAFLPAFILVERRDKNR